MKKRRLIGVFFVLVFLTVAWAALFSSSTSAHTSTNLLSGYGEAQECDPAGKSNLSPCPTGPSIQFP